MLAFAKQDDFFSWFKPAYWINAVSVLHQWRMLPVLCSWHAKRKGWGFLELADFFATVGRRNVGYIFLNSLIGEWNTLHQKQLDSCNKHNICRVHSSFWHLLFTNQVWLCLHVAMKLTAFLQALQGLMFLLFTVIDEKQAEQTVGVVIQSSFSLSVYCPAIVPLTHFIDLGRGGLVLCHSHLLLGERINDPRKRRGRKEEKKNQKQLKIDWGP